MCSTFEYPGCVINKLGNFLGGEVRNISSSGCPDPSGSCHVMPDSWQGEVHDDSLMLSEALWELRSPEMNENYIGTSTTAGYTGLPRADVLVFNALFYHPDNFANFLDAMIVACEDIEAVACDETMTNKIHTQ